MSETPDVIGTLRGYRAWRVSATGQLKSVSTGNSTWAPGVNHSTCPYYSLHHLYERYRYVPPGRHQVAPVKGCSCGFYACYDPRSPAIWQYCTFGVVECHGVIIEHELNTVFRAQYARIVAVHLRSREDRDNVLARYPDVVVYKNKAKLIRAYPPEGASRLRAGIMSLAVP